MEIETNKKWEGWLKQLQPHPSRRYYQRMRNTPWTPVVGARRWIFATAGFALVLMTAFLFLTPQGQTLAQGILKFFTHAEGDVIQLSPAHFTAIARLEYEETLHPGPYQTPTPASGEVHDVSLAEAGRYAGFDLIPPSWIPDTIAFEGASFNPEWKYASMTYLHNLNVCQQNYLSINVCQQGHLYIQEEPIIAGQDCRLCKPMEVGASEPVETVQIGNTTGEFATGSWYMTDTERVWEDTPVVKTLRWRANGMAFEMIDHGVPDGDMGLTLEDMLTIAESIK